MTEMLAELTRTMREVTGNLNVRVGAEFEVPYVCRIGPHEVPVTLRVRWTPDGPEIPDAEQQIERMVQAVLDALPPLPAPASGGAS